MATQIRGNTQIMDETIGDAQIASTAAILTAKLTAGPTFLKSDGNVAAASDLSMGGFKLTDVANGVDAQDLANFSQLSIIDNQLDLKGSVRAATTVTGTLATAFANASVIDGVTLATNDRILIKNQSTASENGIYDVQASGAPVRSSDADTAVDINPGMFLFVEEGTLNNNQGFILATDGAIVVDTTGLIFEKFTGAGQTTAGLGLTKDGNQFDVNVGNGTEISSGLQLNLDSTTLKLGVSGLALNDLTDGNVLIGNVSDQATGSAISGDISMANDGTTSITGTSLVNADFNTVPGIGTGKLADELNLLTRDGLVLWTANFNADSNLLNNVTDGDASGDLVNLGQLNDKLDDTQLITDDTLGTASNTEIASALAVKTYTDTQVTNTLSGTFVDAEVLGGVINGVNLSFTIAVAPQDGIHLSLNGLRQTLAEDYSIVGTAVTMVNAPDTDDVLRVDYR